MGIDVHDVGRKTEILKPGMIITCEPGIYIANESIGVRLENDILITENGNLNLLSDIPVEIDEIESLFL
jgi:Xaa-Pro aminopeptidase